MKFFTKALAIAFVVAGSQAAQAAEAGLFVEPSITYERGDMKIDYPSPLSQASGSINGVGLGARVGMHVSDIVFLGADLRYSKPEFKDSSNDATSSSNAYNYGVVAGVQMPIVGLRVWGSYILGGELDPESSTLGGFNVDQKFTGGTGYRVGVGMQVIMVSVNLEYQKMEYKNMDITQPNAFAGSTDAKLKNDAYILSVSFPIAL